MSSLYGNDKSAYILEVNHQKDRINRIAFYLCCLVVVIPISLTIYQEKRTVNINDVNDFIKIKYNLDGKYRLVSNINFDEYKPEVLSEVGCKDNPIFNGVFQGNGHVISNLHYPLFYCLGNKGKVENVKLTNVNINLNQANNIGAIAYYNYGTIKQVYINGEISGNDTVGGVVGSNQGYIKQVLFAGTVKGNRSVGGIAGVATTQFIISESQVSGEIEGKLFVGGIAGELILLSENILVHNNLIEADVIGDDYVGGISGYSITKTNWNVITGNIDGLTNVGFVSGRKNTPPSNDLFIGTITGYDQEIFESLYVKEDLNLEADIPSDYLVANDKLSDVNWLKENLGLDSSIWDINITNEGITFSIISLKDIT